MGSYSVDNRTRYDSAHINYSIYPYEGSCVCLGAGNVYKKAGESMEAFKARAESFIRDRVDSFACEKGRAHADWTLNLGR